MNTQYLWDSQTIVETDVITFFGIKSRDSYDLYLVWVAQPKHIY